MVQKANLSPQISNGPWIEQFTKALTVSGTTKSYLSNRCQSTLPGNPNFGS